MIFNNKLEEFNTIKVVDEGMDTHWAETEGDTVKDKRICNLEIYELFPNQQMFLWVVAHEMVHVYEWQIEGVMSHGLSFQKWKRPFARYGLPLSVRV